MAKSDSIHVTVVTPEFTLVDTSTDFVVFPLFDGEIGVAPDHAPFIGRLGYGELRIGHEGATAQRYYIDGGFVQVADNDVSVVTNSAIPAEKLDAVAARSELEQALQKTANTEELLRQRTKLQEQARAKIHMASHHR